MTEFDENHPISIEISPGGADPGTGTGSSQEIWGAVGAMVKEAPEEAIRQAFNTIYSMARRTEKLMTQLKQVEQAKGTANQLSGMELEFGLKFDGNVQAYIAEGGSEAAVTVKLQWQARKSQDG